MGGNGSKVEAMSAEELHQLKCSGNDKYDQGKTMQQVFDTAVKQVVSYLQGLETQD